MMRKFGAVTTLMFAMITSTASAQGVAGKWKTEFDIGIRNENGVETSMGKREATMTLTQKGDSIIGTWQVAPDSAGRSAPPVALKGTRAGAKVVLESEPIERTVRINDDERRIKLITRYRLEMKGNELVGTSEMSAADGSIEPHERPFSAKRAQM